MPAFYLGLVNDGVRVRGGQAIVFLAFQLFAVEGALPDAHRHFHVRNRGERLHHQGVLFFPFLRWEENWRFDYSTSLAALGHMKVHKLETSNRIRGNLANRLLYHRSKETYIRPPLAAYT